MHIAIDCRPIRGGKEEMAGIGHYVWHLVRHLLRQDDENRYTLFFDDAADRDQVSHLVSANHRVRAVTLRLSRFKRLLPYAYSHRMVASAIARSGADVFHATTGSTPLGYRGHAVATVHDLAIYDHPEWFPNRQFFSRRFVVPASLRRAERLIAVSHATKKDLQRLFALPSEKIAVIHEGVELPSVMRSEAAVLKSRHLAKPYILFLSTVEPRKNVASLVRAFETLVTQFPGVVGETELVIAGGTGWKSESVFKEIAAANRRLGGTRPRIRTLGYVPADEKFPLMACAQMFVFPSYYEGFGLPVLEAMRVGTPVIASNTSSIPEIAGRGAALLVDPRRHAELSVAMRHLLTDEARRTELGRRGRERAVEFSWERAAGETLEMYGEAARART